MPMVDLKEHSMRGKMNVNMRAYNSYDSPGGIDEGQVYERDVYIGEGEQQQKIGTLNVDTNGTQFDGDHVFFTAENYEPGAPVIVEGEGEIGRVPATSPSPLDDFTEEEAIEYMEGGTPVGDAIGETLQEQREQGTGVFSDREPETDDSNEESGGASESELGRTGAAIAALVVLAAWRKR